MGQFLFIVLVWIQLNAGYNWISMNLFPDHCMLYLKLIEVKKSFMCTKIHDKD